MRFVGGVVVGGIGGGREPPSTVDVVAVVVGLVLAVDDPAVVSPSLSLSSSHSTIFDATLVAPPPSPFEHNNDDVIGLSRNAEDDANASSPSRSTRNRSKKWSLAGSTLSVHPFHFTLLYDFLITSSTVVVGAAFFGGEGVDCWDVSSSSSRSVPFVVGGGSGGEGGGCRVRVDRMKKTKDRWICIDFCKWTIHRCRIVRCRG